MTASIDLTQAAILKALGTFLADVLPAGVEVFVGQTNRVPEPKVHDFVVMTPIRRERIETNVDDGADVAFTGSVAGNTLTVTAIDVGTIDINATLFGVDVAPGSRITGLGTGGGGVGTYAVSPAQTLSSRRLSSGAMNALQPTNVVVQLDVHGPSGADNAQRISTLLRDEYAVAKFAGYGVDVVPLLADDPRQLPFLNSEQQYEDRWVIEAMLQANIVVSVPQQFADEANVGVVSVEAAYPA